MSGMAERSVSTRASIWGPAIFTLLILALLIGLGVWQLQRRVAKHALIATLAARVNAPPSPLPPAAQWPELRADRDEFRLVKFAATLDVDRQAQVYASGSALRTDVSGPGAWIFAPAHLAEASADAASIVINRGFVPQQQDGRAVTPLSAATGSNSPTEFIGYIRFPEQPGVLTPHEDAAKRLWFARDIGSMAQVSGWGPVAPFYIDLESPAPASGLPKPGPLEVHLRDEHMQYAITWFGLAFAVAIAFVVWFRGQRRA